MTFGESTEVYGEGIEGRNGARLVMRCAAEVRDVQSELQARTLLLGRRLSFRGCSLLVSRGAMAGQRCCLKSSEKERRARRD